MTQAFTPQGWARLVGRPRQLAREKRLAQMESWVGVPEQNTVLIPLLKGSFAKVDSWEAPRLDQFNWYLNDNGYARTRLSKQVQIYLHQLVLRVDSGMEVDHRNCDPLDNRITNLRTSSRHQNSLNREKTALPKSSKYKGVGWDKSKCKWMAFARSLDRRFKFLGYFDDEKEAARAHNVFAIASYGEFARPNVL